jgi:hypothetical protein
VTQTAARAGGDVSVEEIDHAEVKRNIDILARRFLGMTGDEFLACRADGRIEELGDSAAVARVLSVATLLD